MAQKVLIEMVDDIDGEVATQKIPFSLDGVLYEIDLSDDNASNLREELARFVGAATRVGGRTLRLATGQSAAPATADRERSREIREWAQRAGYAVSGRGRLSSEIVEAYEAAHAKPEVVDEPVKVPRKRAPRKKVAGK